jgi:hypothetical protein
VVVDSTRVDSVAQQDHGPPRAMFLGSSTVLQCDKIVGTVMSRVTVGFSKSDGRTAVGLVPPRSERQALSI